MSNIFVACNRRSILLVLSLSLPMTLSGQEASPILDLEKIDFPVNGTVSKNLTGYITLRKKAPTMEPRYRLGEKVCLLGKDTELEISDIRRFSNFEYWYKVEVIRLGRHAGCKIESFGWTAGVLAGHKWINLAPQQEKVIFPMAWRKVGMKYGLLILGTLMAVIVVTIHRANSISPKDWPLRILVFQIVTLVCVNLFFAEWILKYQKVETGDNTSLISSLFAAFAEPTYGFLVLGFVMSMLSLKFLSFAKDK